MTQLATTQDKTASRLEYVIPAMNLRHDADGFTLEVEMPGVRKDGLDISFDEGKLTLTGHRAVPAPVGSAVYTESGGQAYRRVIDLDLSVEPDKISAKIDQGLLTLRLPKAEASKPRKITVS